MVVNPAGFQPVYGKDWDVIPGVAREAISGAQFVFLSGAAAQVGSVVATFNPQTDLLFATDASGTRVNGIALYNAGSNSPVSVARRGTILVPCEEAIVAGDKVDVAGAHAVRVTDLYTNHIGRSLTDAASGGFVLVDFDFS